MSARQYSLVDGTLTEAEQRVRKRGAYYFAMGFLTCASGMVVVKAWEARPLWLYKPGFADDLETEGAALQGKFTLSNKDGQTVGRWPVPDTKREGRLEAQADPLIGSASGIVPRPAVNPTLWSQKQRTWARDQLQSCLQPPAEKSSSAAAYKVLVGEAVKNNTELFRLHNRRVAHRMRPLAVVFPENVAQVSHAVRCAMGAQVPVYAQSGKHAYEAYCRDHCLLVVTTHLVEVIVNPSNKSAKLGAGLNLGQVYTKLGDYGFAIPGGTCPTVGLAGLTLGAGKGVLTRYKGFLIDFLYGVDVVLPNGTFVSASQSNHPDLLWMARGACGNVFPGVVTAFHFNLVEAPASVVHYDLEWLLNETGMKAFQAWQDGLITHPDLRVYARLEIHPYNQGGTVAMSIKMLNMGKPEAALILQPIIRGIGPPFTESISEHSWVESVYINGGLFDGPCGDGETPHAGRSFAEARELALHGHCGWDSGYNQAAKYRAIVMKKLSEPAIITLLNWVRGAPFMDEAGWSFYIQFDPSNGAAAHIPDDATAYPWRSNHEMTMQVIAKWNKGRANPRLEDFNFGLAAALQPYAGTHSYCNYIDANMPGGAVPLESYWGPNRLKLMMTRSRFLDLRLEMGEDWLIQDHREGTVMKLQHVEALEYHTREV